MCLYFSPKIEGKENVSPHRIFLASLLQNAPQGASTAFKDAICVGRSPRAKMMAVSVSGTYFGHPCRGRPLIGSLMNATHRSGRRDNSVSSHNTLSQQKFRKTQAQRDEWQTLHCMACSILQGRRVAAEVRMSSKQQGHFSYNERLEWTRYLIG